jgi:hypothetical protein
MVPWEYSVNLASAINGLCDKTAAFNIFSVKVRFGYKPPAVA